MNIEMLNVGWISSPAMIWRQGEDPAVKIRFPVPAWVIDEGEERILVDTGLNPSAIVDPAGHYGSDAAFSVVGLEQEADISRRLDLGTVTKVVLTHLHYDHVGGLGLLPANVPIYVQRREWEAGREREAIARNFFFARDYELDERPVVLLDGDHDLLGDGSVELLSTPGHTPGHQSVRVGEQLVLGVDVGHFAVTYDDHRFPMFADDFDAQTRSAERLRALREDGANVLPGHDPDVLTVGPVSLTGA